MGTADEELSRLRRSVESGDSSGEASFLAAWRRRGFQIREALLALPRWRNIAQQLRRMEGEPESALQSFAQTQSFDRSGRALRELPQVWVEIQLIAGRGLTGPRLRLVVRQPRRGLRLADPRARPRREPLDPHRSSPPTISRPPHLKKMPGRRRPPTLVRLRRARSQPHRAASCHRLRQWPGYRPARLPRPNHRRDLTLPIAEAQDVLRDIPLDAPSDSARRSLSPAPDKSLSHLTLALGSHQHGPLA